jgi:hypothetical protein
MQSPARLGSARPQKPTWPRLARLRSGEQTNSQASAGLVSGTGRDAFDVPFGSAGEVFRTADAAVARANGYITAADLIASLSSPAMAKGARDRRLAWIGPGQRSQPYHPQSDCEGDHAPQQAPPPSHASIVQIIMFLQLRGFRADTRLLGRRSGLVPKPWVKCRPTCAFDRISSSRP